MQRNSAIALACPGVLGAGACGSAMRFCSVQGEDLQWFHLQGDTRPDSHLGIQVGLKLIDRRSDAVVGMMRAYVDRARGHADDARPGRTRRLQESNGTAQAHACQKKPSAGGHPCCGSAA